MTFDNRVARRQPADEPVDAAELPTTREEGRVTHDAATEMLDSRGAANLVAEHAEDAATDETTERIEGQPEAQQRIETQKNITEKAQALDYAINARMRQLEQERENATLWWKILDTVFRRAGEQQARLGTIQREIQNIGSTLHHPSVHQETLARIAALEKELYSTHNVPEVLAAPSAEYEGVPIVRSSLVGKMKPTHIKTRVEGGKLGQYGQDGVRVNEASGTSVIFDGIEALDDSYSVGEKVAEKAEEILHGLPDTKDTHLIESYIRERYGEIEQEMERLPDTVQGAAVFIAKRFLPKSKLLVAIKVGDCEIVVERPNGFVNELLPNPEVENAVRTGLDVAQAGKQRQTLGIGITNNSTTRKRMRGQKWQPASDPSGMDTAQTGEQIRKTVNSAYSLIITPAHKGDRIRTTTDGFYNNTGMHLADAIKTKQFEQFQQNLTSEKDDVVILTEEL